MNMLFFFQLKFKAYFEYEPIILFLELYPDLYRAFKAVVDFSCPRWGPGLVVVLTKGLFGVVNFKMELFVN